MSTPEGATLKACLAYLSLCGIFHFRCNNQGVPLHDGSGKYRPSPAKGLPDIIGIAQHQCVLSKMAHSLPLAVEAKSATGRQSPAQREFELRWEQAGGLYILCRSVEELREALRDAGVAVK